MPKFTRKKIVYLAGGFRSGWQDKVIEKIGEDRVTWLDPRTHGLKDEAAYTEWDLDAIERSDIVFGFMEEDNPSGAGLALELGYAYAFEKFVIFLDQTNKAHKRYWGMARSVSNVVCQDLDQAIEVLHTAILVLPIKH